MASRLLVSYARLLFRASSKVPALAAARLPLPVAGPAEVQRAQRWPWISERFLCEGQAVANKDTPSDMPPRTQLDDFVDKAAVPEEVLSAWAEHGGNSNQAANALIKWTHLMLKTTGSFREQQPEVMKDPRLLNIKNTILQGVRCTGTVIS